MSSSKVMANTDNREINLSLIICAYNSEEYLWPCLESVSAQSILPTELIVVDDGSTDSTGELADRYAASHEFCQVLHGENEGLLLARRKGLSRCRGEYVMFLDSDDVLRSDAVEVASRTALDMEADIVIFRMSRNKDFSSSSRFQNPKSGTYYGQDEARKMVLAGNTNTMWGKLYKHSLFDIESDYRCFSGLMHGEDLLQTLPVFGNAKTVVVIDECLYYYRPNDGSSTASYKPSQRKDVFVVLEEAARYANEWGMQASALSCWARNVTYLLTLLFEDRSFTKKSRFKELEAISTSVRDGFPNGCGSLSALRVDYRLILRCLIAKRYRALGVLVTLRKRLA